ncbi:MAG: hypothetical protein AAGB28_17005 [Pseudomonadota bacterium]
MTRKIAVSQAERIRHNILSRAETRPQDLPARIHRPIVDPAQFQNALTL